MRQSQRGKAPPDPTEKKLLTHHQLARKRKRSARLAAKGRNPLERTTLYPPPMTTAATPPRPYRREATRGLGRREEIWWSQPFPFSSCLNQQCVMRSAEQCRRADGNSTSRQASGVRHPLAKPLCKYAAVPCGLRIRFLHPPRRTVTRHQP